MPKGLLCPHGQNNIIATLSGVDRELIEPHLQIVQIKRKFVLEEPNTTIRNVYFPISGVSSTVAFTKNGRFVEVGLFGSEGMSGTAIVMDGEQATHMTFMQIGGEGLVIDAATLRKLMDRYPSLRLHMLRFVQCLMTQTARTALANNQSSLEERLARWLLMCHDRIGGNELNLTHAFLSVMLGVRRAGVTVATHVLESKGLIRATRGRILILDREGIEEQAQGIYGVPEAEYARLIGYDRSD